MVIYNNARPQPNSRIFGNPKTNVDCFVDAIKDGMVFCGRNRGIYELKRSHRGFKIIIIIIIIIITTTTTTTTI